MDRDLESCQLIASDKSKSLTTVDFLLKSGFQVLIFFIILEVRHLVIIAVNEQGNYFRDIAKWCLIGLFENISKLVV